MNRKKIVIPILILAAGGYGAWRWLRPGPEDGLSASGTVEATEARLGFQASGRIVGIGPREGDVVRAGDTLATLDRSEALARRAQAAANLAAAQALLAEMLAGARVEERSQSREALRAATEQLEDARRDADRTRRLVDAGALSQEAWDKARLALEVAQSRHAQALDQDRLVSTGPRAERIVAQRAAVEAAHATLRQADAALTNSVIVAPFAGLITVRDREIGETVAAGSPVLTLMDLGDRWVRIYIPEDRIGAVRHGQAADISADTYPDRRYSGTVSFIASQAEFTPRNVQTREERVKLVYAVKVRITGDEAQELKPGLPADVTLR